jgi:diguanylate cyclase (GGDEF)-like protein/PAS domain S-box-containing protein
MVDKRDTHQNSHGRDALIARQQEVGVEQAPDSPRPELMPSNSNACYQQLVEKMHQLERISTEGHIYLMKDWCVDTINQEALRILGYNSKEVLGESLFSFTTIFYDDERQVALEQDSLEACLKREDEINYYPINILNKKKALCPCLLCLAPLKNADNQVEGYVLILQDITRQKLYEKRLVEQMFIKEKRAQARTKKLMASKNKLKVELDYQKTHDSLTGLYNRQAFESQLSRLINESKQYDAEHIVAFIDLDKLNLINNTCGHMAGDELIRQIATLLKRNTRKTDMIARYESDIYALQLLYCNMEQGLIVLDKLRDLISNYRFEWNGHVFNVTTSIGCVGVDAYSGNVTKVLGKADTACQMAKEQGRDRAIAFKNDEKELISRYGEIAYVAKTNRALDEDSFELYGQIIEPLMVPEEPGLHFEILVRMVDDDGSLIAPGMFLPIAERYHQAKRIDTWVVEHTFQFLSSDQKFLDDLAVCSINLSGQSVADDALIANIVDWFEQYKIPPGKICFEITETAAISDLKSAERFIQTMHEMGALFALDDFGRGLSSFAYLRTLPVDFVKIDGMFIKDIVHNPVDYAMVRSINEIAHVMNKKTIAEFVEDIEIKDKLRELGVDYVQGFGIGKPGPLIKLGK